MLREIFAGAIAAVLATNTFIATSKADIVDHFALQMVWMPALCKFEPDRPECKDLSLRRYDGRNLALMSLQAAPPENGFPDTYCFAMPSDSDMDRSRKWCDMDPPRLNPDTVEALKEVMPITQSCQERGIWAKYGTCALYSTDAYFSRGIMLARAVAGTQVNTRIAAAVGTEVSQDDLMDAFTAEFGDNSANAISFFCRKFEGVSRLYQVRITVSLRGVNKGLAKDLLWIPHNPVRRSCPAKFLVDLPPVKVAPEPAAPAAAAPSEPVPPQNVPVGPVETEPLPPQSP